MNALFTYIGKNWKSTISATLTCTLAITGFLLASGQISAHTTFVAGLVQIAAKQLLGFITLDTPAT